MKRYTYTVLLVALALLCNMANAQRKPVAKQPYKPPTAKPEPMTQAEMASEDFIAVLSDGRNDSILVRWAPSSLTGWQHGVHFGYRLERYTISAGGKINETPLGKPSLLVEKIKYASKEEFEKLMLLDERAAIVSAGIYNEDFKPVGKDASIAAMISIREQYEAKVSFTLFACDLNPLLAKAAGLMYVDKNVKAGERYLYRVSLGDPKFEKKVRSGYTVIEPNQKQRLAKPDITGVEWGDRTASVIWDTRKDMGIYTAYYLEKSTDSVHFTIASDLPIATGSENGLQTRNAYVDSLPNNVDKVYYRLRGITPFGEVGPYAYATGGRGRSGFEVLPVIRTGTADAKTKSVSLSWEFNREFIGEVQGFHVLRAKAAEGSYIEITEKMLPVSDTTFIDTLPGASNYYKIKAVSKMGGTALSFPYLVIMSDNEPPVAPTGIRGKVGDSGFVRLVWKQNKEKDLLGYKVFRANNLGEDFTEITPQFLTRNELFDTIEVNTLTKKVYYKVVAVDVNFNLSAYSEPFELKRPDVVPPAKPVFTKAAMVKNVVNLEWLPSASEDVVKYTLARTNKKDGSSKTLLSLDTQASQSVTAFIDTTATLGNVYYYSLTAIDAAGNTTVSRSGEVDYETGLRKAVTDFTALADTKLRTVTLRWNYPTKVETYYLYRCKKGQPMVLYQTLEGNTNEWVERRLSVGFIYQYQIKAALKGDLQTEISKVVEVKY